MEKCHTCVYYKEFLFARPVCTRVSNVHLKTQKNVPFKLYEGYKICKGYFYEPSNKRLLDEFVEVSDLVLDGNLERGETSVEEDGL